MTKEQILNCALVEFSQKGLSGSRIDDIAKRAGVNKQRIYAYYKSKDNLFAEALSHCFTEMRAKELEYLAQITHNFRDLTKALLSSYFIIHQNNPCLWRILAWANLEAGDHSKILEDIKGPVYKMIREIYTAGQEAAYFSKEVEFKVYMYTLFSVSSFYFSNRKTLNYTLGEDFVETDYLQNIEKQLVFLLTPRT